MHELAAEMVTVMTDILGSKSDALRVARVIHRHFGGQQIYLPLQAADARGKTASELRGLIADEIGDRDADEFVQRFCRHFGGILLYIPLELYAFREVVADEVYRDYNGTTESMSDLCRRYRTTYRSIYVFFKLGRKRARGVEDKNLSLF